MKLAAKMRKDQVVVINISGRGDKDIHTIAALEGVTAGEQDESYRYRICELKAAIKSFDSIHYSRRPVKLRLWP